MSLASQTLTASGENGTNGSIAVPLATDFATVLATLLCRARPWKVLYWRCGRGAELRFEQWV